MPANLPSLKSIVEGASLKPFELDVIDALIAEAEVQKAEADLAKKALVAEVTDRYGESINAAYLREAKDTGTVHVSADGYHLEANRPKKVDWDQAELDAIAARIRAAGDDPSEYLDLTYTMQERRYTALPASIAKVFAPARTVRPGAMTIKLSKVEMAK